MRLLLRKRACLWRDGGAAGKVTHRAFCCCIRKRLRYSVSMKTNTKQQATESMTAYGLADAWGSETTDEQAAEYRRRYAEAARVDGVVIEWTIDPYAVTVTEHPNHERWFQAAIATETTDDDDQCAEHLLAHKMFSDAARAAIAKAEGR
jgi:hypothetical protein